MIEKIDNISKKLFDLFMIILVAYFAINTIMIKLMIILIQAENKEMCITTGKSLFSPIVFCSDN